MTELVLIMVSAILVNNFVLVQFLGLCPFMGVSKKIETAIGLSLATTFVLTLAAMCSYLVQQYVLKPLDLEFLRTISFILVIAVTVQFTEMVVNKTSPLLYRVLGIFLPLITTNCIVLGVALLNANKSEFTFITATVNGFAAREQVADVAIFLPFVRLSREVSSLDGQIGMIKTTFRFDGDLVLLRGFGKAADDLAALVNQARHEGLTVR